MTSRNNDKNKTTFQWTREEGERPERTFVVVPDFSRVQGRGESIQGEEPRQHARSIESKLAEAQGLAEAISLDVIECVSVSIKTIRPSTLFGKGKTEELSQKMQAADIGLAIVDSTLSPVQQQNLEKAWNCKVLDRTGLILEIFGERAKTKEGRLQVDLAHLNYQKGRLVRSWTHLERQRGALGFVGGPGETQIEADRRQIQEQINRLEKELEKVRRTRTLHRSKRKKVPFPVVALVGYTNAGKSTLFNLLTGSSVFAKDLLFATLDPTLRQLILPEGTKIILSDTVGFVSNLPTHLVAAFRATLEEVVEAELVIHVRDISDPDSASQAEDVMTILKQLGLSDKLGDNIVEVWNKIDLIDQDAVNSIRATRNQTNTQNEPVLISAVTGEGIDALLQRIEHVVSGGEGVIDILLPVEAMGKLNDIYEHAYVIERRDNQDGSVSMRIRVAPALIGQFSRYLAKAENMGAEKA